MWRKSFYHLFATVLCCLGTAPVVLGLDVYVAPQGSAENPGTRAKPVATLEQARALMRQSGRLGKEPCTVWMGEGVNVGFRDHSV